jgi:hypothetical protein
MHTKCVKDMQILSRYWSLVIKATIGHLLLDFLSYVIPPLYAGGVLGIIQEFYGQPMYCSKGVVQNCCFQPRYMEKARLKTP